MQVYTFFDPLPSIARDDELMGLWAASWENKGWQPNILSRSDIAYEHLDFARAIEASPELKRGPCPDGYNIACHLRWCAFLSKAPALFVDYDCLNAGFEPEDLIPYCIGDIPLFLSGNNCPCAVYATSNGVRELLDILLLHARQVDSNEYDPSANSSELCMVAHDQAIFGRFAFKLLYPRTPLVRNYSSTDGEWKTYPLWHFPNDTTPKPRGATIHSLNLFQ